MRKKKMILMFEAFALVLLMMSCKKVYACEAAELSEQDQYYLQKIALAEAENQGIGGMSFVMQVVLNRAESEEYPSNVMDVIAESGQFTAYEDGRFFEKEPTENSKKALELLDILQNRGALYFENQGDKEATWHSENLVPLFEYKDHCFYK